MQRIYRECNFLELTLRQLGGKGREREGENRVSDFDEKKMTMLLGKHEMTK